MNYSGNGYETLMGAQGAVEKFLCIEGISLITFKISIVCAKAEVYYLKMEVKVENWKVVQSIQLLKRETKVQFSVYNSRPILCAF
jgi:hypothetical protein